MVSAVSQPLPALPSQLPQFGLQVPSAQVPALQSPVALAGAHGMPQPPQLVRVRVEVSQPFASNESQFA